jgi:DNA-directed RNA polymerase subunit omega
VSRPKNTTMMNPAVENLMERTHSKFSLVTLASRRAREITEYYQNLQTGGLVPPSVTSVSTKPLSIAFEEIAADKVRYVAKSVEELLAEAEAARLAEEQAAADAAAMEAEADAQ